MSQFIHFNNYKSKTATGFTLLEVLVALAIFAVLSLAGWKVFDSLIKVRERNQIYTEQLSAMQSTYTLMLRDFSQASARPARNAGQIEPALLLDNNKITFTRMGAFDPTQRSQSSIERVTYEYDASQQRLIRTSYRNPDQAQNQTPPVSVLLSKISNFSIQVLEPSLNSNWPPANDLAQPADSTLQLVQGDSRLPQGVQVEFTLNERPIIWRFSLVKKLPDYISEPEPSSGNGENTNGSNSNSNNTNSSNSQSNNNQNNANQSNNTSQNTGSPP